MKGEYLADLFQSKNIEEISSDILDYLDDESLDKIYKDEILISLVIHFSSESAIPVSVTTELDLMIKNLIYHSKEIPKKDVQLFKYIGSEFDNIKNSRIKLFLRVFLTSFINNLILTDKPTNALIFTLEYYRGLFDKYQKPILKLLKLLIFSGYIGKSAFEEINSWFKKNTDEILIYESLILNEVEVIKKNILGLISKNNKQETEIYVNTVVQKSPIAFAGALKNIILNEPNGEIDWDEYLIILEQILNTNPQEFIRQILAPVILESLTNLYSGHKKMMELYSKLIDWGFKIDADAKKELVHNFIINFLNQLVEKEFHNKFKLFYATQLQDIINFIKLVIYGSQLSRSEDPIIDKFIIEIKSQLKKIHPKDAEQLSSSLDELVRILDYSN